ncbi:MAG: hypothetical protein WBG30_06150 [Psychrilyobacter sp.]|uniref:FomA family porin-like outer membrane protein n=1 Tax=Psychrilyobacter sp. TaxID=2586924 RepID=UPI003C75D87B
MNKKILLLAGILALGATSFAAEGARDFLDGFKDVMAPKENITGYWNQEFKAYSDTESKDDKQMRLENEIGLNLTDKLSVALRTRTFMAFPGKDKKDEDNFRFDMSYDNGTIGNTELGLSQRVRMYKEGSNAGTYSYRPNIDFSSYIGADTADANLEFLYKRVTKHDAKLGNSDDIQKIAYDIDMEWTLGYGFSTEVEFKGAVTTTSGAATESALYTALFYDYNLYTSADEACTLDFHTEASATPVKYNHKDNQMHSNEKLVVETETYMKLNHKWTNNFSTYGQLGVTTKDDTKVHTSNFGTQGYAALGLSYAM